MADTTIPQTVQLRKSFSNKKQYLEGFSKADYDMSRYDMSGQLRCKLEKAILSGTNEQAFTILSAVDAIDHIPGAGEKFVPLNGFASYYGVSEEYLKGVLNRRRFLQKKYPNDVKRIYASDISGNEGIPLSRDNYMKVPGRDDLIRYRLSDAYGVPCVSLPKRNSFLIYSPKIVLATALHLLFTDKSGANNTAKKVALAVKRSDYRVVVPEPEESEDKTAPENVLAMSENGGIALSKELLDYIVRIAVRYTLDELADTVVPTELHKPKALVMKKPDGWDGILAKWKYGKLTTHKAAEISGMSVNEFRDYATGKKTFD